MKHSQNPFSPEAATDGPASSRQPSRLPAAFEPDLGALAPIPGLTSSELVDAYVAGTMTLRHAVAALFLVAALVTAVQALQLT